MTAVIILLAFIAVVAYALHHNHLHNERPRYAGSGSQVENRDLQRVRVDLIATAGHAVRPGTSLAQLTDGHHRTLRAA